MAKNGKVSTKVEPLTRVKKGRYGSILEMVRDLSDPKLAHKFEKHLKKLTVWIVFNTEKDFVQVFKRFKSAKLFISGLLPDVDLSEVDKEAKDGAIWEGKNIRLFKSKIVKA